MSRIAAISLGFMALVSAFAVHAEDRRPLSVEVKAGAKYDSNVSIEQADVITRHGDMALTLGASAKYRAKASGSTELTAGYDFDQTFYADLTDYNLQLHQFSVGSSTRVGKANLGADYRFFHIRLGGQPFLDMQTASPSVSGFVSKNTFLRASYSYFHKAFATASRLDANTHEVEANAYYFFMRKRSSLGMTVRYAHETTVDLSRAYDSFQISGMLQLPIDAVAKGSKLRLGIAYRDRHYRFPAPSIGAARREKRYSFSAAADIPIGHGFSLKPEFRAADQHSNDPYTDYTDGMSSLSLVYRY